MAGRRLAGLAVTLIGFAAYFFSVYYYCLLVQIPVTWQIVCEDGESGQTAQDYEHIQGMQENEESPLVCAFWKKEEGQTVENSSLGRTCTASVWKVRGNLEVLFYPFVKLQEDDLQGCYLSEKMAGSLFGSAEVVGSQVLYGKRQLTVRGILKDEEPLLVMRPGEQEATDRVTLAEQPQRRVESFQMQYQIPGTAVNSLFLGEILQWLILLFPTVLAVVFFRDFHRLLNDRKDVFPVQSLGKAVWWALLAGVVYFLFNSIDIPETMIPDQWSDFQFWETWWESAKEQILCFVRQEWTGNEMVRMGYFVKSAVCSVVPFFIAAVKKGC